MSSMSAPDSGHLPRPGEIFFDVRGGSRSMRLSWYSDTGVAVFSIWQGGTCTGTFRLPFDDMSRLVDSLRRGLGVPGGLGGTGQAGDATGPMALDGQRPQPAGGFGTATGSFGLNGAQAALPGNGNGAVGSGAYPANAGEQYGTAQQYEAGQQETAGQYGAPDTYGTADQS